LGAVNVAGRLGLLFLKVVGGAYGYEGWLQIALWKAEPVLIFEVTTKVDVVV
jgi:hypothetical protein